MRNGQSHWMKRIAPMSPFVVLIVAAAVAIYHIVFYR
jgi:hypothetical protein